MKYGKLSVTALLFSLACSSASAYETTARNAILMDFDTGEYLYEKNITEAVPPASMSKLMTVYILMSKIKDKSVKLDDTFLSVKMLGVRAVRQQAVQRCFFPSVIM